MTVQIVCLLIGALLPYVWSSVTARYNKRDLGGAGLDAPRQQAAKLAGAGARARDAEYNAWEALIVFGVANGAALSAGAEPSGHWALAAPLWVAARALHGVFYVAGLTLPRRVCWAIGLAMSLWIFGVALTVE